MMRLLKRLRRCVIFTESVGWSCKGQIEWLCLMRFEKVIGREQLDVAFDKNFPFRRVNSAVIN